MNCPTPASMTTNAASGSEVASATGAYRFIVRSGTDTVRDLQGSPYLRAPVARLGIPSLTCMLLAGENQPVVAHVYRPQVQHFDGRLSPWVTAGRSGGLQATRRNSRQHRRVLSPAATVGAGQAARQGHAQSLHWPQAAGRRAGARTADAAGSRLDVHAGATRARPERQRLHQFRAWRLAAGSWRLSLDFGWRDALQPVGLRLQLPLAGKLLSKDLGLCPCTGMTP